jgi:hypothetical protein
MGMAHPVCPYCQRSFTRSRFRPDQTVCSGHNCQRQRRAAYHRNKLAQDPVYHAQCRDSQKLWREQHPDYMPAYRRSRAKPARKPPPAAESSLDLVRLLESVKNNVAIDLKSCSARVLLLGVDGSVKNTVATAQLILIEGFSTWNSSR